MPGTSNYQLLDSSPSLSVARSLGFESDLRIFIYSYYTEHKNTSSTRLFWRLKDYIHSILHKYDIYIMKYYIIKIKYFMYFVCMNICIYMHTHTHILTHINTYRALLDSHVRSLPPLILF